MKLFNKFFSIIFLLSSLVLLSFVFYRSEIFHDGQKHTFYLKYYIFSISLLISSIIFFFLKEKIKIFTSILIIFLFFSFYIFETFLFLDSREFRVWKSGVKYDKRSEIEFYSFSKKNDNDIKMIVAPVNFLKNDKLEILPLSGISNKKTILCNEHGYNAIYKSDRYGFNNPDLEWDKKNIDFLLVGDSFTHGTCVNTPDSIAGILRKLNKNTGVITLGYMANGPLLEYASLKEYLPIVKPKNVIWLYYENDLWDLKFELKNKILLNYLNDNKFSQNLYQKQDQINEIVQKQLDIFESDFKNSARVNTNYSIKKFIKLHNLRIFFKSLSNEKMLRTISPQFKSIIKLAHDYVKKNQSNFYFVYIPEYKRYKKNLQNDYSFNDYEKVINYVKSLNIPIIDLNEELFQKNKDPLSLYPFRKRAAGFSPEINVTVTDIIYNKIKQNN